MLFEFIRNPELYNEAYIKNIKDIYYNKDQFDSGEINLCFITGHSGFGKSTMANNMSGNSIEDYKLVDVNKNKKYVIEGVWLFMYIDPEKLKDYAVYIKGTSRLISDIRAAKRDSNNDFPDKKDILKRNKAYLRRLKRFFTVDAILDERKITKYRNYFSKLQESS